MSRIVSRGLRRWLWVSAGFCAAASVLLLACGGGTSNRPTSIPPTATGSTEGIAVQPTAEPTRSQFGTLPILEVKAENPDVGGLGTDAYMLFNQRLVEGLYHSDIDLEDVDDVFWFVFSRLPDEITVYPSENYYYYIMYVNGQQFWGNIRLPAGRRERGVLSFAYFEFIDYPSVPGAGFSRAKYFTEADGLRIEEVDPFTWIVHYNRKSVTFHLHKLVQKPPKLFSLGEDEVFVQRTFDESGYQFFLIFNEKRNYFIWILNEEEPLVDVLEPLADDVTVGQRSGFAFWIDRAHDDRKILAMIRRIAVSRNDYYDGPFDQLADNYVDKGNISEYMQRAYPGLRGRIDKYGYYTDTERSSRVALSNYGTYFTHSAVLQFIQAAKESDDPYHYISRSGAPLPTGPTPTPPPKSE